MRFFKLLLLIAGLTAVSAFAQGPPPSFSPSQLDELVARIALYPDPLVAQILAGASYSEQIAAAAKWSDQHHYLKGKALADAIQEDQLPWDPSVQALLPFPSVMGMMASDMRWTTGLGNAFLAQQQDVMSAIQRERRKARSFGYLRDNGQIIVGDGPYLTIIPVNPEILSVPYYDPRIVFFPPRPGIVAENAIHFGFGISIGGFFRPWGWGNSRVDWPGRTVFINNARWQRNWGNRREYAHPFVNVHRYGPGDRVPDRHELFERSERERNDEREGRRAPEEHHGGEDHGLDGGHDHR